MLASLRRQAAAASFVAAVAAIFLICPGKSHASLVADFTASNYNATTGVWTDSVVGGPSATALSSSQPTLITSGTGTTANGSATLHFTGSQYFTLSSSIPVSDYSVFVYVESTNNNQTGAFTGGAQHSLEYRINPGTQDALSSYIADYGHSTTTLPTTSFSSIGVQVPNTAGTNNISFYLNGIANGTASNTSPLASPILNLGATTAPGSATEFLQGYVAEIRIYSDVTTSAAAVNSAFQAAYVPEPSAFILGGVGAIGLLVAARRRKA